MDGHQFPDGIDPYNISGDFSSGLLWGISEEDLDPEIMVKEEDIRVEGQTSGEWVPLGEFALEVGKEAFVEISNQGADGVTVADAVLWVPER